MCRFQCGQLSYSGIQTGVGTRRSMEKEGCCEMTNFAPLFQELREMNTRLGLFIGVIMLMSASCGIIDPAEKSPAFIHIDEFSFSTDFIEEGSNSNKITEIWVFNDGLMLGAYDTPAEIPVLSEGATALEFRAGIKNNGIAATRIMYPFYESFNVIESLSPLESNTVSPSFTYKEGVEFSLREEFEDAGNKFITTVNSDTTLFNISGEEAFENSSGKVVLHGETNVFQVETDDELDLPAGKLIWVEMDYKCNNSFAVGLKAFQGFNITKDLALVVNPTTDIAGIPQWNKIYVELSFVANQHIGADYFKFYIESNLDADNDEAELFFDNIKIVHFE